MINSNLEKYILLINANNSTYDGVLVRLNGIRYLTK